MEKSDIQRQMDFLIEAERLKTVYRQNMVVDKSRQENSAEHSWHLALMAIVLGDRAIDPEVDIMKVIKMVLVHDIVEIDAGDTFLYDAKGYEDKDEREQRAANRIFGLLPESLADELLSLWREFEERKTPSALFAAALDNMQPVINHWCSGGAAIKKHHIKASQIIDKKKFIEKASPELWEITLDTIKKSSASGFYDPE